MPNRIIQFLFLVLFSCFGLFRVQAQEFFPTQRKIEKTRIQFQTQSWKYISSDLFEVYFFGKNESLARNTLQILESESPRMTELLGYTPIQKAKVFVYPSQDDLFQSNTGISFESQQDIRVYNLDKFRIEIAFQDDWVQYKNLLLKSLAEVYVHEMLFSGSVKDVLQNSLFLNVPDWFLKGVCAYVALGETAEMNQFMFQSIRANKIRKINLATGYEAELLGQSIWSYIVRMYGKQPISNILNLTRIIRNEQSSVASTIKKPFGKFLQDWYKYYYNQNSFVSGSSIALAGAEEIKFVHLAKGDKLGEYAISPDGSMVVYSVQSFTKFESFIYSFATKKKSSVFRLTINDPLGLPAISGPKFSWSKGNSLHILYNQEGKNWLNSYAALNPGKFNPKLVTRKELKDLNCLGFEMHPGAQKSLLKVLRNGQVDLGIYDLRRGRFSPITQDKFNESSFKWADNGNEVYYVSENITDTTLSEKQKQGMNALYKWNPEEGASTPIFSIQGSIKDFTILRDSTVQFVGLNENRSLLLNYTPKDQKVKERLVDIGGWHQLAQLGNRVVVKKSDLMDEVLVSYPADELLKGQTVDYVYEDIYLENSVLPELEKDTLINSSVSKRNAQRKARIERNQQLRAKSGTGKSNNVSVYENSFASANIDGYFKSDPIRGLGYALQTNMNDLMENHLIQVGAFLAANLKNSDVWGEYNYLEKRTDWTVRFDRKVLNQEQNGLNYQKIRYNRIELKALYPFDLRKKLAVSGTYSMNRLIDQINFRVPEDDMGYAGLKTEYQYDNTLLLEENLPEGQRVWASAEFQKKTLGAGGFFKFKLDVREYYTLTNWLHLFGRFSASQIVGVGGNQTVPQTILGGMDNWLFQTREGRTTENPLGTDGFAQRDVFMSDFAAPLRGFGINKMSGASHLLLNLEAHVNVKKFINQEQERSQFLNNLQLVAFTDIGTAWSGSSPFSKANGFNTNQYGGKTNPFTATVTDFRNPFLMGVGVGVRSRLLGYYVKLDYAVGISDGEILPSITYLTLGRDF